MHTSRILARVSPDSTSPESLPPLPWDPAPLAARVLEGVGEGVAIYDRELRYRMFNRVMEERSGLSAAAVYGKPCYEIFPHMVTEGVVDDIRRALAGERVGTHDFRYRSPYNGRDGWYTSRLEPLTDEGGQIVGVIGHILDITDRKVAEAELRRSEARFRTIIEGAGDVVTILDRDGIARYSSPAVTTLLGWAVEECVGRNPIDRIHPDDREEVLALYRALVRVPEQPQRLQYRSLHADGSWRVMMSSARNLLGDPAVRGIVVTTRDMTAWVELQERLHQSQRIEAVGRLAGGVAHDFNNLLTVIRGNAQLLQAARALSSEAVAELDEIAQAAERAATLTRQLLAFSRQQVLQPRVLDLNAVVTGVWRLLERLVGAAVSLEFHPGASLGAVTADPVQVEQVLLNLVVNARDAMPGGGVLAIETGNVAVDDALAQRHAPMPAGRYVQLAVRDTGVGMDAVTMARAFEPFFTTKALGHGTGMGLSTVYGVVKQSGGYIWVDSEPGKGASFTIYLPVSEAPAPAPVPSPRPALVEGGRGSETILVAEDEPLVRAMTRRTLERAGYRVYQASNGEEALTIARELGDTLDLLITDIVMPVMGGRELVARLQHERPSLRILFMSGYTHERDAYLSEGGGVSHFLHKPFTLAELRERVRLLLDQGVGVA